MAEVNGNRTRQAEMLGLVGFEDRGAHQDADTSLAAQHNPAHRGPQRTWRYDVTEPTICLPASNTTENGEQVDEETMTRLRQAVSRIARQLNNTATDEGLTPSQATILGVIARRGPINLTELAELEGLNPTMLSRMVSKLDSEGLISRSRAPEDLRSAAVKVTRAGRTLEAKIRAGRAKVVARAMDGLGEKQQQTLTKALPALEELVEQLRETQSGPKR